MKTVRDVLTLLGVLFVVWTTLALYEACTHAAPLIGK